MGCHKIQFQMNVFVLVWGVVSLIKACGWTFLGFITPIKLYGIASEILVTENQHPENEGFWETGGKFRSPECNLRTYRQWAGEMAQRLRALNALLEDPRVQFPEPT